MKIRKKDFFKMLKAKKQLALMPKPKADNGQIVFETSLMIYFHNEYNILLKWAHIDKILSYIDFQRNLIDTTGLKIYLSHNHGLEISTQEVGIIWNKIKQFYAETYR